MKLKRWQALIFDLDDTLYPERDYVLSGFRAVSGTAEKQLGIPAERGFSELRDLFNAGARANTFNRWLRAYDLAADELVRQFVQVYRDHKPVLSPFFGVPGLLQSLHSCYRLGLVSDGYLTVQKRKLAALNIASYFDAIVFSDQFGRNAWKPHPQAFEEVLRRLNVRPSQSVYVADNPIKDFLGARNAGMYSIRLRTKTGVYSHAEPETPQHAPDFEIRDICELGKALGLL